MRKIVAAALAGLTILTVGLWAAAGDATAMRKAPELSFSVPGAGAKLLSQYRGKVVALEFIFTTCPHCQAASHVMSKFQTEFASRGLQVLDIAVNENADLLVENFAKDYQTTFPVGWASRDQMVAFMGFTSGRFVVPQLVIIDRKGNIRYQTPALEDPTWDKLMNEDTVRQHIEELLAPSSAHVAAHGVSSKKSS